MVFYLRVETCAPEVLDETSTLAVRVSWQDPIDGSPNTVSHAVGLQETLAGDHTELLEGAAVFGFARSLKTGQDDFTAALDAALAAQPTDPDLLELQQAWARLE
jgi:hypothetical protein